MLSNVWTFLALILTQSFTFYQYQVSIILLYYLGVHEQEERFTKGRLINILCSLSLFALTV